MKKTIEKMLTKTAELMLNAGVFAAGCASLGGLNQPKEPANFKEVVEKHSKNA